VTAPTLLELPVDVDSVWPTMRVARTLGFRIIAASSVTPAPVLADAEQCVHLVMWWNSASSTDAPPAPSRDWRMRARSVRPGAWIRGAGFVSPSHDQVRRDVEAWEPLVQPG